MRAISNNSQFHHDLTDKFAVYDKFPKTAVHVTDQKVPINIDYRQPVYPRRCE